MRIVRKAFNMLIDSILYSLPFSAINKIGDELLRIRVRTQEIARQKISKVSSSLPIICSTKGHTLARSILENNPPWDKLEIDDTSIPGMLTDSEKRYYTYISDFYSGRGSAVELGPWLGQSTFFIASSLKKNPSFTDKKLFVYDDFIWRSSWMDKWLYETTIPPIENHSSFQSVFENLVGELADVLSVKQRKFSDYDGNESCKPLKWSGGDIELLFVDCGRSLSVNEGWWSVFSQSFIPNKTLIIMQDWQHYKTVPEVFWENTKIFTDSKGKEIELIHELKNAGLASFLYKGVN